MARPKGSFKTPSYREKKKGSGKAVVTINGKDYSLGSFNSAESKSKYHRLIAEWEDRGKISPAACPGSVTVAELVAGWWIWAERRFARTHSHLKYKAALKAIVELYGTLNADQFSPLKLKAFQMALVKRPRMTNKSTPYPDGRTWSRQAINMACWFVRDVYRWAAENELISGATLHSLKAVRNLVYGETEAREMPLVESVPEWVVDATCEFLPPTLCAMIDFQRFTGARPGEVFIMRTADIDMSDASCWIYTPRQHKTQHRGRQRHIGINPAVQGIIAPFLKPLDPEGFVFTPKNAKAERKVIRRKAATLTLAQLEARDRKHFNRARKWGQKLFKFAPRFGRETYHRAISIAAHKADEKAHKERPEVLADMRIVPHWHAHQLRHLFITTSYKQSHDIETIREAVGHADAETTRGYIDRIKAGDVRDAVKKIG